MLNLQSKYINQASYILHFKSPIIKVRFLQELFEDAFSELTGVQSEQTNVPDNFDPNMARIIFNGKNKSVIVSQLAVQMNFNFEDSSLDYNKQLQVMKKNIIEFHKRAIEMGGPLSQDGFGSNAIIFDINMPSNQPVKDLNDIVHGMLLRHEREFEVASFALSVGYRVDDLFVNISQTIYEKRSLEFVAELNNAPVVIDPNSAKLIESGLQIKLDVNDRPRHLDGIAQGPLNPVLLIDKAYDFSQQQIVKFLNS